MANFQPSPVLLSRTHEATPTAPTVSNRNGWIKTHEAIAPYLALVARASKTAGIEPEFQAAILAQENGGFIRWSTNAVSSAGAEGIAQFILSTWQESWNPYRNQSRNNPTVAIAAQAILLRRLLRESGGDMARAAGAYYGAMDPHYVGGVKAYYSELKQNNVFGSGGISGNSGTGSVGIGQSPIDAIGNAAGDVAGGIIGAVTGTVDAVPKLIDTLLHPEKLGELVAEAFGIFLRFVFKMVWKYCLAPPFHWAQRAVIYYFENIMGSKDGENSGYYYDYAAAVTVAFWSVGYAVLWRNSENLSLKASPKDTVVGKAVGSVGEVVAKRNVSGPDKVKDQTPDKPEPRISEVNITKVKTLSANRRRQVSVSTNGTKDNENGKRNETESGVSQEADPSPVESEVIPA